MMGKLDQHFSYVYVCPATNRRLSDYQHSYGNGVCAICGHKAPGTFSHAEIKVGRWYRPTFWQRLMGAKPEFLEGKL
jgi:hypothetical protein